MIPEQNIDHIVVQLGFRNVNDLMSALVDAGVLPGAIPADTEWGEYIQPLDRFDMDLGIQYRVRLFPPVLDAYEDENAPGGNEIRLSLGIEQGAIRVFARERSSGDILSSFEYALSGRAFIYGSLETDDDLNSSFFVISRPPEFKLDDWSDRIPELVDRQDTEVLLARSFNRAVRLRPSNREEAGQIRIPISFEVDEPEGMLVTYGLALRDIAPRRDEAERQICLPEFGQGDCDDTLPLPERRFYLNLDTFARVETSAEPVPIDRADRDVQVDVGWRVINRELSRHDDDGEWKEVAAKFFRYRHHHNVRWHRSGDRGYIRVSGGAQLQMAYPKIKWCRGWTKLPFGGRISYKYPCGIERGWLGVKDVSGHVDLALHNDGTRACVEIADYGFNGNNVLIRQLLILLAGIGLGLLVGGILNLFGLAWIGSTVSAAIIAVTVLTVVILHFLEDILNFILRQIPNEHCMDIADMLKLAVIENKVDAQLALPVIDMNANGLTVAVNADFMAREDAEPEDADFVHVERIDAGEASR